MARTKGSKNRATIERMKQQEEFEKFMKIKAQMENEDNNNSDNSTVDYRVAQTKNFEETKEAELEQNKEQNKEQNNNSQKEPVNSTNPADPVNSVEAPPPVHKKRGRPKKNPDPITDSNPSEPSQDATEDATPPISSVSTNASPNLNKSNKTPANNEKYSHCERCHTLIMCQPNKIDMDHLTNSANYHRAFPRFALLCPDCTEKLNKVIDDFLWDSGEGMEPKPYSDYGMKNFRKEDNDTQDD